jgi:hypothetical protein
MRNVVAAFSPIKTGCSIKVTDSATFHVSFVSPEPKLDVPTHFQVLARNMKFELARQPVPTIAREYACLRFPIEAI